MGKEKKSIHEVISGIGLKNLIIIGVCGVALIVLTVWPAAKKEKDINVETDSEQAQSQSKITYDDSYVNAMEKELSDTLEKMGVGNVEVMITLKSSYEEVVLKDETSQAEQSESKEDGKSSKTSNSDNNTSNVVSFDKENGTMPYVISHIEPRVEGILIVTENDVDSKTISDISDAAQALFSVQAHKIKVIRGEQGGGGQ